MLTQTRTFDAYKGPSRWLKRWCNGLVHHLNMHPYRWQRINPRDSILKTTSGEAYREKTLPPSPRVARTPRNSGTGIYTSTTRIPPPPPLDIFNLKRPPGHRHLLGMSVFNTQISLMIADSCMYVMLYKYSYHLIHVYYKHST